MHAPRELFTTDAGLMSGAGLSILLAMGVSFVRYLQPHGVQDAEQARMSQP